MIISNAMVCSAEGPWAVDRIGRGIVPAARSTGLMGQVSMPVARVKADLNEVTRLVVGDLAFCVGLASRRLARQHDLALTVVPHCSGGQAERGGEPISRPRLARAWVRAR